MHTAVDIETKPSTRLNPLTEQLAAQPAEVTHPNADIPTSVWGLPFAALRFEEAVNAIHALIQRRSPTYFVTANLQYLMLSHHIPDLQAINDKAALILADGMPIVWRSRWSSQPLPERIAGSDLIYAMAELADKHGYRMFFLGGDEGVAAEAAQRLQTMYPGMVIAGVESPPFRPLMPHEEADLAVRIREACPDMLVVALGQPGGEKWIARWHMQMQVPVSVQLGGSFNFVTGRIRRSPGWIGAIGMEWAHRLWCEPRRLGPRYLKNLAFLSGLLARDLCTSTKSCLFKAAVAAGACFQRMTVADRIKQNE